MREGGGCSKRKEEVELRRLKQRFFSYQVLFPCPVVIEGVKRVLATLLGYDPPAHTTAFKSVGM